MIRRDITVVLVSGLLFVGGILSRLAGPIVIDSKFSLDDFVAYSVLLLPSLSISSAVLD